MPQWLVLGISGVTCGGKTTLANSLSDYFEAQRNSGQLWNTPYSIGDVHLISQDDYFLPVDDLRHKWNGKLNVINFELMTSLDMKQMLADIQYTIKGNFAAGDHMDNIDYINEMSMSTNFEHYAPQAHHYQNSAPYTLPPPQQQQHHIMRVNSQMAAQLRDNKINIMIIEGFTIFNQPELLALCNIKFHFHLPYEKCFERRRKRSYDPPDVTGYFEICVWPHYEQNFAVYRDRKDITFLNGEIGQERIFKFVLQRIVAYFEERCDVGACPPRKLLGIPHPGCGSGSGSSNAGGGISKGCPMEQQ